MFVFGTGRGLYDPLLIDFGKTCNGSYISYKRNVELKEKTEWIDFDYEKWLWDRNPISFWGTARGTEDLLHIASFHKIDYYFWDHGYFGAKPNTITGRYRILKNARHITHIEDCKPRYEIPKITKEFKNKGSKILICLSNPVIDSLYMRTTENLVKNCVQVLQKQTDREIVIRPKGINIPLEEQLKDAYCVITTQSTVMIQALLKGIPCVNSFYGPGIDVCNTNIDNIENLFYPEEDLLYKWLCTLDNYSFTADEIKNGFVKRKYNL